jgi:hypothetical protein
VRIGAVGDHLDEIDAVAGDLAHEVGMWGDGGDDLEAWLAGRSTADGQAHEQDRTEQGQAKTNKCLQTHSASQCRRAYAFLQIFATKGGLRVLAGLEECREFRE